MKKYISFLILIIIVAFQVSCKKNLEEAPDKHLVVIHKLSDIHAILDYTPHMMVDPGADESSADNYYISDNDYNGLDEETNRQIYTWGPDNQFEGPISDWGIAYRKVYIANTALEALKTIPVTTSNETEWKEIKGQALFIRGRTFWQIANIWCLAFDSATAATGAGIPLRMNTEFNEKSRRASLKETFDQIIADLTESISLLPSIPAHKIRPSKPAAYGFLSRVYISMRDYHRSQLYADSCLQLSSALIDYNDINTSGTFSFNPLNPETIFYSVSGPLLIYPYYYAKIDTLLYSQYEENDLRKTVFFSGNDVKTQTFKGSYAGYEGLFSGIATNEILLNKAECLARAGQTDKAMDVLNLLLINRHKEGTFIPLKANNSLEALKVILIERRKELVMRFTRWMDIKRLNKEGAGITLKRIVNGKTHTLPPDDLRYALAIPEDVISISGMKQNRR